MAMNLNNYTNEYKLFEDQTDEIIQIYGISIDYIKTKGMNKDDIFGEYTHKHINQNSIIKNMPVLPENSEEFETLGNTFSKFGFTQNEVFNCYMSARNTDTIGYENIRTESVGDIIILPNGKKFEITFVDNEVKGTNNMFTYTNNKNVYMFKTKLWSYNGDSKEEDEDNDKLSNLDFSTLDELFSTDKKDDDVQPEDKKVPSRVIKQNKEKTDIKLEKTDVFGVWG